MKKKITITLSQEALEYLEKLNKIFLSPKSTFINQLILKHKKDEIEKTNSINNFIDNVNRGEIIIK